MSNQLTNELIGSKRRSHLSLDIAALPNSENFFDRNINLGIIEMVGFRGQNKGKGAGMQNFSKKFIRSFKIFPIAP